MIKPSTQYTKSGRINIAYQVFGSGSYDLVYIPGWVSNIDWMWACPELVSFLTELGKIARVILFDKRGTGLSDRIVELSTLEERMDDLRAVMDAAGSKKAVLFGHSEGGSVSALFAATYPNRVISLITFGIFAKRRYSPKYPWAPTDEERQRVYDMIEHDWGSGEMNLASLAPSKAGDKTFMDWLANYFRSGASPSAAMVLTRMNTEVDIIDILSAIKVPTLLMQRTHDIDVKMEEGHFIAERIPEAKFVELTGDDHLFWVGDTESVLNEIRGFILNSKPQPDSEIRLYTILAARFSRSDAIPSDARGMITQLVGQYRGHVVQFRDGSFIAKFEGPSKAVHCGIDLIAGAQRSQHPLAIGIHITESTVSEAYLVRRETAEFSQAMLNETQPGQIFITQTVKNLLSGAGLSFRPYLKMVQYPRQGAFSLFVVSDDSRAGVPAELSLPAPLPRNESFLENILQMIDAHLSDEFFGVDRLCKEIGISERQLQRKLKATTNKSPTQLISSVRLHRAKELLLNQDNTIAEIAFRTGFASPSYFSKCFRKEFGRSPSELVQQRP